MGLKNSNVHKRSGIRGSKLDVGIVADLGAPLAVVTNHVVASVAFANGSLTIAAQPDVPRNLTGTLTDGDTSVTAGIATITYIDPEGVQRVRVVTFAQLRAGWAGTDIVGKVVSIVVSAMVGGTGADVVVFGIGLKIGLPSPIEAASQVRHVYLGDGAASRIASPVIVTGLLSSAVDVSASTYNGIKRLRVNYSPGLAASTR